MRSRSPVVVAVAILAALNVALANASQRAVALELVAEGFTSPSVLTALPGGGGDRVIADQIGTVHVLDKAGRLEEALFLDLRGRMTALRQNFDERGLLGLAFHPRFMENRKFYVYYGAPLREGAPAGWDHTSHVSEFKVKPGNPREADLATERVLLRIDEPQFNHNGGRLAFGPDGFLYIGIGDGGNKNDEGDGHSPQGNGQDLTTLLGKILRIDVDRRGGGREYGIPADNPFANGGGRPEIFAWGIRNPWGLTFDRAGKRELFAADVGQSMYEEVNIIVKGGNYGWRLREGFVAFDPATPLNPPERVPITAADGTPLRNPIIAYKNFKGHPGEDPLKGISVTGGYIYRGRALPELQGRYVFGDWSRNWGVPDGVLFAATRPAVPSANSPSAGPASAGEWKLETLNVGNLERGRLKGYIVAFGEDDEGELYVLTSQRNTLTGKTGKVYKLMPQD
jgi:glucose/arabinose dehydrogenase